MVSQTSYRKQDSIKNHLTLAKLIVFLNARFLCKNYAIHNYPFIILAISSKNESINLKLPKYWRPKNINVGIKFNMINNIIRSKYIFVEYSKIEILFSNYIFGPTFQSTSFPKSNFYHRINITNIFASFNFHVVTFKITQNYNQNNVYAQQLACKKDSQL